MAPVTLEPKETMWTGIRYWFRRKTRKSRVARAEREFQEILASLGPDDIVVDCGANVGIITTMLAETGATVHSFEPDPGAFQKLKEQFASVPNVVLHNQAVGTKDETLPIYMSKNRQEGSVEGSVSTSLLNESNKVSSESEHSVAVIDFLKFLDGLASYPRLVKIDIEGFEVALLEKMFETGIVSKIGKIFVETHEKQIPSLRSRTFALIDKANGLPENNVNMDWK